jgi:N-acetylmuramoyl-L-alanine amidase
MRPVRKGDTGKQVVDIQTRLAALGFFLGREGADGVFGPHTEEAIRTFQQRRLLCAHGVVDENTWMELVEAGYKPGDRLLYLRVPYLRGDDVLYLQRRLDELGFDCGPVDGIFSPAVEIAVTEFQKNAGLNVDGIVGETTFERLRRLQKMGDEGRGGSLPDRMNGYVGHQDLGALRISIDPAHGGSDVGHVGAGGILEKDVNLALARELARRLQKVGTEVFLVHSGDPPGSLYERLEAVNAWQPDIHLCIHHAWHHSPRAQGAAAFYFANSVYESKAGKRLAGYLVDALTSALGRTDLHKHGRNYACLREVKPLSVMVEPGFLSHPEEGPTLVDPRVLAHEAEALVSGIRAYLERV